jgi:hypothetical protein
VALGKIEGLTGTIGKCAIAHSDIFNTIRCINGAEEIGFLAS